MSAVRSGTRAIVTRPRVLLVDEPPGSRAESTRDELLAVFERGRVRDITR